MSTATPAPATVAALECKGVTKRFGTVIAVSSADLNLPAGQFMALLGPSGCGKTTLLRLIAGFEEPDLGIISIGGRTVVGLCGAGLPPEQRRVGMVFQDYALFPHLSVTQNVAYGLPRSAERYRRAAEVLELVGLAGMGERMPHQLSGGQQQRVALARALAPRPALLLLDEPFSNLDAGLRRSVRSEVRQILRHEGVTVLFVTHDQEEALSLCDAVAVMIGGQVAQAAPPRELYERPVSRAVAAFVGEAGFVPGEASGDTVACPLGRLALARPTHGPVEVLVRPELLDLSPDPAGPHRVADRSYFGHDQLVDVRLADGTTLQARSPAWLQLEVGQPVGVTVRGPVVAYPRA